MNLKKVIHAVLVVLSLALSAQASVQLLAPQDESIAPVSESTITITTTPTPTPQPATVTSSDPAAATSTDPGVATTTEPVVSPLITPEVQSAPAEPDIVLSSVPAMAPGKDTETKKANFAKVSSDLESISSLQASADSSSLLY